MGIGEMFQEENIQKKRLEDRLLGQVREECNQAFN